ncbi:hypothetical protein [Listeria monocytogenes]|uniref:hypothetical protein n=1 Tax=Listeria monocytogenes TaxID=1639 RepID=UPI0011F1AF06|nr:hypothetical protein [Listeria monocytogenes]TYV22385.1 hypothetical protein FZ038_07090 [Listeria monocytogenes]
MSKKWIGIILLSALFLLVGCGKEPVENKKIVDDKEVVENKEVINSKFTGKWKLETASIGKIDRTGYREVNHDYSREFEIDRNGIIKEVIVDDDGARTYTFKIMSKGGDEYQNDGSLTSEEVFKYETEAQKEYVKKVLELKEKIDSVKIIKSEQKGNEYYIETEQTQVLTFFMYLSDKKLIKEAVDEKENYSGKDIYIKK